MNNFFHTQHLTIARPYAELVYINIVGVFGRTVFVNKDVAST